MELASTNGEHKSLVANAGDVPAGAHAVDVAAPGKPKGHGGKDKSVDLRGGKYTAPRANGAAPTAITVDDDGSEGSSSTRVKEGGRGGGRGRGGGGPDGKADEGRQELPGVEKVPFDRVTIKRLLQQAKPWWKQLALGTVCLFLGAISRLAIPALFGRIIDAISIKGGTPEEQEAAHASLLESTLILITLTVVGAFFNAGRGYLFNSTGERVVARLRCQVFDAIMASEVGFFDATRTGELLSRLSNDTAELRSAVTTNISMALRWASTIIGGLLYLFVLSWKLSLLMLGIVPVVALSARWYGSYLRRLAKATTKALAKATEVADESMGGVRTVRSFAREHRQSALYAERIDETLRLGLKAAYAFGGFVAGVGGGATLAFIGLVYYGGTLVIDGELTSGVLTSYLLYSITIGGAMAGLAGLFGALMKAAGATERVFQILDRKPLVPISGGATSAPMGPAGSIAGHVEFRDVDFSYPTRADQQVLRRVSFTIAPGTVAALVGPSGGGKSTVVNLIERFYDVDGGAVMVDGADIRTLDPMWLRRRIGLVRQEPVLFAGSIRDNITFGLDPADTSNPDARPFTDAEVEAAARKANAHGFISAFPEGYDTVVGERGVRLSGGQKQRVAIARALLLDPRILLLDEATSALDADSEKQVQEALDRLMVGRTTLIIAHRLSTVRDAAQVMVVDGGRLVGQGTHDELMASSSLYATLVAHQLVAASPGTPAAGTPGADAAAAASATASAVAVADAGAGGGAGASAL